MTREEASIYFKNHIESFCVTGKCREAEKMAIQALEQELILDKIRTEIAEIHLIGYATVDGKREIASRAVMQIIDKYKTEIEPQESEEE